VGIRGLRSLANVSVVNSAEAAAQPQGSSILYHVMFDSILTCSCVAHVLGSDT
jgi:hypothetical protein